MEYYEYWLIAKSVAEPLTREVKVLKSGLDLGLLVTQVETLPSIIFLKNFVRQQSHKFCKRINAKIRNFYKLNYDGRQRINSIIMIIIKLSNI